MRRVRVLGAAVVSRETVDVDLTHSGDLRSGDQLLQMLHLAIYFIHKLFQYATSSSPKQPTK